MTEAIDGVTFDRSGNQAICHVDEFSEELKSLIRKNLSNICHGSIADILRDNIAYSYNSTLSAFLQRYDKKDDNTKKGMIGEFLSHILLPHYFEEFEVASVFFNLEENSIKKGFDLILYKRGDQSAWITEVKSGNLHQNKTADQTTSTLLNKAKDDLNTRLNEENTTYWYNAINHVRAKVADEKDYKNILVTILAEEVGEAIQGQANSEDNQVVLISSLFSSLEDKITHQPAETILTSINNDNLFLDTVAFSIQKEAYQHVVDFIRSEAEEIQE